MTSGESERRRFLKTAGSAAMALVATGDANAQTAEGRKAARGVHNRDDSADGGLWITWYDLPDDGRAVYLSWLHEQYLPALLKRPGYLWAAHYATRGTQETAGEVRLNHVNDPNVPAGYRYMLLVGGKDVSVFGNPGPSTVNAALPEEGRKMLAMRIGERVNLMTVASRCEGRARNEYKEGLLGAPCIQLGSFNCPVEYQEELHDWYVKVRLPAMCATGSCIRVRELNSVAGWAKHGILYEFTSDKWFSRDYDSVILNSPPGIGGDNIIDYCETSPRTARS
jgi:hypothetical protein